MWKADSMRLGGEYKTKLNYSTYQTKFDAKKTKMKLHGEYDYDCIRKTRLCYLLIFLYSSARVSGGGGGNYLNHFVT